MEHDSTTLQEPLLLQLQEKDVERNNNIDFKKHDDGLMGGNTNHNIHRDDDGSEPSPVDEITRFVSSEHPGSSDEPNHEPFVFTMTSELVEMANLAWPLAVSFFCRMGMASTDSAFVGHIPGSPETYLAAAVLSDMVVNCLITPPLAFNQVLNSLVAQAIGSGNPKTAGIWLQQSMFWLSTSMLPFLVGFFHVESILVWIGFPHDISKLAGTYAKYNILWPIPNGWYQCMRFYFQAQGLPRPAMYNNILFLFINAFLNYFFVFFCKLGFIGAAISLSVSRSLQPVLYYLYMFVWKQHHTATWPGMSWSYHTKERTMMFLKQAIPNVGTLLFQQVASQAITIFVGKLGTTAIAVSSALSTIATPLAGTVSATSWTVSSVRVGFHLGRGDPRAARQVAFMVLACITIVTGIAGTLCFVFRANVLHIATNEEPLIESAIKVVPAMLVGTYLSLIVGNITSGVFSGMGRPILGMILSFGFELPLSILGVAVYVLKFHGNLLGVYWLQAGLSLIESIVVAVILFTVDWDKCAEEVQRRQEPTPPSHNDDADNGNNNTHPDHHAIPPEEVIPLVNGTDDETGNNVCVVVTTSTTTATTRTSSSATLDCDADQHCGGETFVDGGGCGGCSSSNGETATLSSLV